MIIYYIRDSLVEDIANLNLKLAESESENAIKPEVLKVFYIIKYKLTLFLFYFFISNYKYFIRINLKSYSI
jgi:hypothetical protein